MRKLVTGTAVVALVFVLAACGGGSSTKTPTAGSATSTPAKQPSAAATAATGAEDAFAASMLMAASDFPAGYLETAASPDDPNNPLRKVCGNAARDGSTGHAVSSEFAPDQNSPSVQESVIVFPDAATATAALGNVPALIECTVKALNDGKLDTTGVKFSKAEATEFSIDAPGDKTLAYQVKATATVSGSTETQVVYLVTTYTRVGRVGYSIKVNGSTAPVPASQVSDYSKTAAAKIKQQP
jgi:hypothetical protein